MAGLQERLSVLEQTNKSEIEDAAAQKSRVEQLEEQLAKVTAENQQISASCQRKIEVRLRHR